MKKVITILMIICIMLCGCSKEEPKQVAPTTEPAKAETKADTKDDATAPTKSAEELIEEINTEIDESQAETTAYNYDTMFSAACIALTSPSALDELIELGDGQIKMTPDGITFDNVGPETQKELINIVGDLADLKFYQSCIITISAKGVSRTQEPGK